MDKLDLLAYRGSMRLFAVCDRPDLAVLELDERGTVDILEGAAARHEAPPWLRDEVARQGHLMVMELANGFVSNGLDVALNKLFNVSGPPAAIQSMVVAKSSTAVASTDTSILGGTTSATFSGASQNAVSKALTTPAPAAASSNAISGGMTFTEADVNSGASATFWPVNRVGLCNVAAGNQLGLIDVIGNNASQANPYSRTFSIDFSGSTTYSVNPQITITGIRRSTDFPTL